MYVCVTAASIKDGCISFSDVVIMYVLNARFICLTMLKLPLLSI